jgi:chemotaxis protein MotB
MRLHQRIRREQGRNNDDWLITYADTITLLLCMFVIMLSVRHGTQSLAADVGITTGAFPTGVFPAVQVAASDNVFGGRQPFPAPSCLAVDEVASAPERMPAAVLDAPEISAAPPPRAEPLQVQMAMAPLLALPPFVGVTQPPSGGATERKIVVDPLPAMVERLRAQGTPVAARQGDRITTLQIGSTAFFGSGFATLSSAGKSILSDVAITLNSDALAAYRISIEGHTDDSPINTAQFQSNWELSTARAAAVVRFFLEQGIPARRLTAAGYADTFPLVPNRTAAGAVIPENQARNRRVVIKLEKIDPAAQVKEDR